MTAMVRRRLLAVPTPAPLDDAFRVELRTRLVRAATVALAGAGGVAEAPSAAASPRRSPQRDRTGSAR